MASVQEAVRRLTIVTDERGAQAATDKLNALAKAQGEVAVVSEKSERATQSMERRLESIQRRYDQEYRAQKELAKLQKDLDAARQQGAITQQRASELMQQAIRHHNSLSAAQKAQAQVQQEVAATAQNFAGALGPVGSTLARLGPWGLAAAAAVGVLAVGLKQASDSAHKFADDMLKIRDISETAGVASTEFQALADQGAKFALSEERIGQVLQRVGAQMEEFRRGQGGLFDLVQRIDPALAREMAQARDTATAIDLLGRVYEKAGESRQKLDRLIGGRGGGTVGLLFQEIGRQGGVSALTEEFRRSGDAIDHDLIKKVAQLKAEIDDMAADARRNIASIYAVPVLETQRAFTMAFLEFSRAAKEFSISGDLSKLIEHYKSNNILEAMRQMRARMSPSGASGTDETGMIDFAGRPAPGIPLPRSRPDDRSTLEFDLNLERARIAALGGAATATERLALRKRELDLAVRDNTISQNDYNRALATEKLDASNQLLQQRIGLLGEDARAADVAAKTQNDINRAQLHGARLTEEEIRLIKEKSRLRFEYSQFDNKIGFERAQIGRSDIDATVAARLRSEGLPIDLGSAEAAQIRLNEQLRIGKDLASDFASGFARDMRNGVSAVDALTNAVGRLGDRLLDIALNKAISSMFGGISLGGLGSSGVVPGTEAMPGLQFHSGGVVGVGGQSRWVHPAYFDHAPRYHRGGIAGLAPDEVPAILQRGEHVIPRGAAMVAPKVNVVVNNNAGADVSARAAPDGQGGFDIEVMVDKAVARNIAKPGSDTSNVLGASGVRPRLVGR